MARKRNSLEPGKNAPKQCPRCYCKTELRLVPRMGFSSRPSPDGRIECLKCGLHWVPGVTDYVRRGHEQRVCDRCNYLFSPDHMHRMADGNTYCEGCKLTIERFGFIGCDGKPMYSTEVK